MIFEHLNHKMPVYKDCTLFEVLVISISCLVFFGLTLSIMTKIFIGYALVGLLVAVPLAFPCARFLCGTLQKIKYGKPYGYYQHLFLKKLSSNEMVRSIWTLPRVTREGKWSVRREENEKT